MPRGPNGERRPADVVGCAVHVMKIATGEIEEDLPKNREGKANGGKARTSGMTAEERSELARKGAKARWRCGIGGTVTGAGMGMYLNKHLQPHMLNLALNITGLTHDDLFYYKNKPRINEVAFTFQTRARELAAAPGF